MNVEVLKEKALDFFDLLSEFGVIKPIAFLICVLFAIFIGRYTPNFVYLIIHRFFPLQVTTLYDNVIHPIEKPLKVAGTLVIIAISLVWLREYRELYQFLLPFVDLAVIVSIAWVISKLFRQIIRIYGLDLLGKLGREGDEFFLVIETLVNVMIGFIAALTFAKRRGIDLFSIVAGLGIVGLAVGLAAKEILEQLLGAMVLYLDRPFIPGDYIRLANGQLGRVESIGLRSTKIRTSAKNTLIIVPNSNLISMEIENVTQAKKVMVLLYIDFEKILENREFPLVQQVIKESTNSVFGIDPGSTKITFNETVKKNSEGYEKTLTQARITFFILGSSENSIQLRKRLLELATNTIAKKLKVFGIEFLMQEPTIYVESPITL